MLNGNVGVLKSILGEIIDDTDAAQAFAFPPIVASVESTIGQVHSPKLSNPCVTDSFAFALALSLEERLLTQGDRFWNTIDVAHRVLLDAAGLKKTWQTRHEAQARTSRGSAPKGEEKIVAGCLSLSSPQAPKCIAARGMVRPCLFPQGNINVTIT